MARMVNADELAAALRADEIFSVPKDHWKSVFGVPIVDAEVVVRCKDCYRHEDEEPGMVWCPYVVGSWVPNNWYCAAGKRKGVGE